MAGFRGLASMSHVSLRTCGSRVCPRIIPRRAVQMAHNSSDPDGPEEDNHSKSAIGSIRSGLSSFTGAKKVADPTMHVYANGLGSLLHIQIPEQKSYVCAAPGSVVGASDTVNMNWSIHAGIISSVQRKLAGGNFFYDVLSVEDEEGDALVAPSGLGDIATIEMDGKTELYVRPGCFLACTPYVHIGVAYGGQWSLRNFGAIGLHARGRGTLAVSSFGGIFRLVLEEDQHYLIAKENLIAWDASMSPEPLVHPSDGDSAWDRFIGRVRTQVLRLLGRHDMYLLKGPGDFYMTSRIEPSFDNLKKAAREYVRIPAYSQPSESEPSASQKLEAQHHSTRGAIHAAREASIAVTARDKGNAARVMKRNTPLVLQSLYTKAKF